MRNNILLSTDLYKFGHEEFYPEGMTKIYSYLVARNGKEIPYTLFYGLQAAIKRYLMNPVTIEDVAEFVFEFKAALGFAPSDRFLTKLQDLVALGYLPIEIKAVEEGTVMPVKNVLMTITNTHPDFAWLVGFLETLLLKIWNTTTVASNSLRIKHLCEVWMASTCDTMGMLPFQVHSFGSRGCSSEETVELSGSAHLVNFLGTDDARAIKFVRDYYNPTGPVGLSVRATEHSVMMAHGRENEFETYKHLINKFPDGIFSIVSDTWNLWNVLTNFLPRLKSDIMARNGKIVIRPDSGDPAKIICGDPDALIGTPEHRGALRLLEEVFGSTINSKGYKVLDPHIGLIYGDAIYYDRLAYILQTMANMGFATENLVVGIGGILLQSFSRDTQGFAIKATYCEVNGEKRALEKDPVTDSKKKSHKGFLSLRKVNGVYETIEGLLEEDLSPENLLKPVFKNGVLLNELTFERIRENSRKS